MSFSSATRDRFDKLLRLATKSTFAGERNNALAAARRLAAKHGMSLGEATRRAPEPKPEPKTEPEPDRPRRHHGPYRRTYYDSSMSDKADALRSYARMRAADRQAEAAAERRGLVIFGLVLGAMAVPVAVPIFYLYLQNTMGADPDATFTELLMLWLEQFFE